MKSVIGPPLFLALLFAAHPAPGAEHAAAARQPAPAAEAGPTGLRKLEFTWAKLSRMLAEHPALRAGSQRLAAAGAGVAAAGAVPNPELEVSLARGAAREGDAARLEWGLAFTVPLDWVNSRAAAMQEAEAGKAASAGELELARRRLLDQAAGRFWRLAAGQQRLEVAQELHQQARELVTIARRRVEAGAARPLEQLRLEVELQQSANRLASWHTRLRQNRAWFVKWLALEPGTVPLAVAELERFAPLPSREAIVRRLDAGHPELAVLRARRRGRRAAVVRERRRRWPEFSLTAFTDWELDRRAWGGVLALRLPLWNFNSAAIERAEYELAAAENEIAAARRSLLARVYALQDACRSGIEQASRYAERILPGARRTSEMVEKTYQLGEASLVELLDARRLLLQVRAEYLELLSRTHTACTRLRIAVGE